MVAAMVPVTAFANTTNNIDKVVVVGDNVNLNTVQGGAPVLSLKDDNDHIYDALKEGDKVEFELMLEQAKWNGNTGDKIYTDTTLAVNKISDTIALVEILSAANNGGDAGDYYNILLDVTTDGSEYATVMVNPLNSVVSSGTYTFAVITDGTSNINYIDEVVAVGNNVDLATVHGGAPVFHIKDGRGNIAEALENGSVVFDLVLDQAKWNGENGEVIYTYNNDNVDTVLKVTRYSNTVATVEITSVDAGGHYSIPLNVTTNGSGDATVGDATVTVESNNSAVTKGTYTFAIITEGETVTRTEGSKVIGEEAAAMEDISIVETIAGVLEASGKINLELSEGFKFVSGTAQLVYGDGITLDNDSNSPSDNVDIEHDERSNAWFYVETKSTTPAKIILKITIQENGANNGDICEVAISGANMTAETLEIATYQESVATFTLTYHANGASGTAPAAVQAKSGDSLTVGGAGSLTMSGHTFNGWNTKADGSGTQYAAGDSFTLDANTTLYAQWKEVRYTLSGNIVGHKKVEYVKVEAYLEDFDGNKYPAVVQDGVKDTQTGKTFFAYSVSAPQGTYYLVVEVETDENVTPPDRMATIRLESGNETKNVNLPSGQAKVKVNKENTETNDTPQVAVGSLYELAEADEEAIDAGAEVEVEFAISVPAENDTGKKNIKNHAPRHTLEFVEFTIRKTVTHTNGTEVESNVNETRSLVEIVIPFETNGRSDITVYRYHDNKVDELTTRPNAGGEYIEIYEDHIVVYASKFSTYAIGYLPESAGKTSNDRVGGGVTRPSSYDVTVPNQIPNGAIEVNSENAKKGDTVTITVTPDEGYETGSITVTDSKGNPVDVTKQEDGTYTFTMPDSKVEINASFVKTEEPLPEKEWENPFTDINEMDWFYEAVEFVSQNNLMVGTTDNTFGTAMDTSRGMIVAILWRLEESPESSSDISFKDISGEEYYAEAVKWAAKNGIVSGLTDELFGADDSITREQLAAILWRYAKYKGYDVSVGENTNILSYEDAFDISEYAIPAMQWACGESIISGDNGNLKPQGKASRAEAAQMLMQFLKDKM